MGQIIDPELARKTFPRSGELGVDPAEGVLVRIAEAIEPIKLRVVRPVLTRIREVIRGIQSQREVDKSGRL